MLSRLLNAYQKMRESLFYIPAMICLLYAGVTFGLFYLETSVLGDYIESLYFYSGEIAEAQSLNKVLLSGMITMTTLVVSVTMVVINLSASQLGPRIIRSVLSDNTTKIYVGFFFGSIAACYVLSAILHQIDDSIEMPGLTMTFVYAACFFNLFVLLAYVHHLAHLSVADSLVTKVHHDLMRFIGRLDAYDEEDAKTDDARKTLPKDFDKKSKIINSGCYGYIQTIDYAALEDISEDKGLVIEVLCDAGDYIFNGSQIAKIHPSNQVDPDIEKAVLRTIVTGDQRTGAQDIAYSVRHMVEVGLRALSPGINDNYTAIIVLDKLSSALAEMFNKQLPTNTRYNEKGSIKVLGRHTTYEDVIDEAFSRIRNAGAHKPDILANFIHIIDNLTPLARTDEQKAALKKQREHIKQHIDGLGKTKEADELMLLMKS